MQKQVKMSIITVSYNCANTIERTIRSVVEQDYPYVEYIVIDGGSADGTKEIIEKYADKLSYWVSEPDEGIYNAMNKALMQVTGDYVNFQGGDDYLYDKHVLSYVAECAIQSKADIFIGNSNYGGMIKNTCPSDFEDLLLNVPNHQAVFSKSDLFKQLGGFDEKIKYLADYDWTVRACSEGATIEHIDIPVCYYAVGGFSADVKACKELIGLQLQNAFRMQKAYLMPVILQKREYMVKPRIINKYLHEKRMRIEEFLQAVVPNGKCCIWGGGKAGKEINDLLRLYGIEVTEIIDRDYEKHAGEFGCIKIHNFEKEKEYDLIIIAAYGAEKSIEKELLSAKREYMIGKDYILGTQLLRVILNMGVVEFGLEQYYCF